MNIFHGRVEREARCSARSARLSRAPGAESRPAAGYARPHELEVARSDRGGGLWATLKTANRAGAIVELELVDDERKLLQVEVARDQYDALNPKIGERLYVSPRKLRVFVGQA